MRERIITLCLALTVCALLGTTGSVLNRDWHRHATLHGHRAAVVAVSFNQDGARAASLDAAGTLCLWDITQARRLARVDLGAQLGGGALQAGEASVAISPLGHTVAISAPSLGTRLWRPRQQPELVHIPLRAQWSPLLALSHDQTMLATMNASRPLRMGTWRTDTGAFIAEYIHNSYFRPDEIGWLAFSEQDHAVGLIRQSGMQTIACEATTGKALRSRLRNRMARGGQRGQPSSAFGYVIHEYAYNYHIRPRSSDSQTNPLDRLQGRHLLASPASRYGGGSPFALPRSPSRDMRLAIHPHTNLVLYDPRGWPLSLYRPTRDGDVLYTPYPYLLLFAALGFGLWYIRRGVDASQLPPPDPALQAQPLPRATRVAIVLVGLIGVFEIITLIWSMAHDQVSFDLLNLLLLPAAIKMWRRRSDGWRKFTVFCVWVFLLSGAALLGASATGQWLDYTVGPRGGRLPPVYGVLGALALLGVMIWLWWTLSNNHARALFAAARLRDDAAHLRRCVTCGYDIRATVAHGGIQCPECGQVLVYNAEQQQTIQDEFAVLRDGGGANTSLPTRSE